MTDIHEDLAEELGKRTASFTSSGLARTMFSDFMWSAYHSDYVPRSCHVEIVLMLWLDDKGGLARWRWMFVIDFIITIPIAIYIYLIFPDTLQSTKAWYFTAAEKALATSPLPEPAFKRCYLGKSTFKRILASWEIYGVCRVGPPARCVTNIYPVLFHLEHGLQLRDV